MYKAVKKTKAVWCYMEALALHTGAPTVHWEHTQVVFLLFKLKWLLLE